MKKKELFLEDDTLPNKSFLLIAIKQEKNIDTIKKFHKYVAHHLKILDLKMKLLF